MTKYAIAYAPKGTRVTVAGASMKDCRQRVRQICRDLRLPIRRTMATFRRVETPNER